MTKPDIDDAKSFLSTLKIHNKDLDICFNDAMAVHALYHRLAAEAVDAYWDDKAEEFVQAIPLSKLKAIMEIKE